MKTAKARKLETAQKIHKRVRVLAGQAATHGLETLSYILGMAEIEAERMREAGSGSRPKRSGQ
jgi:hypothetical protein